MRSLISERSKYITTPSGRMNNRLIRANFCGYFRRSRTARAGASKPLRLPSIQSLPSDEWFIAILCP